ncbi:MAG TPA: hypothetical protein VGT40_26740 [Methylomirabilota bacterium]|jgi:hypothetical protein|nr:hypothetical protein [Methylomirabilota bacterium]
MSESEPRPAELATLAATIERAADDLTLGDEPSSFVTALEAQGEEPK